MDSLALNSEDGLLYWLVSKASLVVAAKVTCTVELCYKTTLVNRDVEEDTNQLVSGLFYFLLSCRKCVYYANFSTINDQTTCCVY